MVLPLEAQRETQSCLTPQQDSETVKKSEDSSQQRFTYLANISTEDATSTLPWHTWKGQSWVSECYLFTLVQSPPLLWRPNSTTWTSTTVGSRIWDLCSINIFMFNSKKAKEIEMDFTKNMRPDLSPVLINKSRESPVFNSWGWTSQGSLTGNVHLLCYCEGCYLLRRLKRVRLPQEIMKLYWCTVESVVTYCIPAWGSNCRAVRQEARQGVTKVAQNIIGTQLRIRTSICLDVGTSALFSRRL